MVLECGCGVGHVTLQGSLAGFREISYSTTRWSRLNAWEGLDGRAMIIRIKLFWSPATSIILVEDERVIIEICVLCCLLLCCVYVRVSNRIYWILPYLVVFWIFHFDLYDVEMCFVRLKEVSVFPLLRASGATWLVVAARFSNGKPFRSFNVATIDAYRPRLPPMLV